jgi:hypothetical protein
MSDLPLDRDGGRHEQVAFCSTWRNHSRGLCTGRIGPARYLPRYFAGRYNIAKHCNTNVCGCSSTVEHQLPSVRHELCQW